MCLIRNGIRYELCALSETALDTVDGFMLPEAVDEFMLPEAAIINALRKLYPNPRNQHIYDYGNILKYYSVVLHCKKFDTNHKEQSFVTDDVFQWVLRYYGRQLGINHSCIRGIANAFNLVLKPIIHDFQCIDGSDHEICFQLLRTVLEVVYFYTESVNDKARFLKKFSKPWWVIFVQEHNGLFSECSNIIRRSNDKEVFTLGKDGFTVNQEYYCEDKCYILNLEHLYLTSDMLHQFIRKERQRPRSGLGGRH